MSTRKRSVQIGWLWLAAVSAGGSALAGPIYQLVDLGALAGGQSAGAALNQLGTAVGWSLNGSLDRRGFLNQGNGIQELGVPSGGVAASAAGINNAGQVVGTTYAAGGARATVWSGGTSTSLGTLGGYLSYATGINDRGFVTGNSTDAAGNGHAFVYSNGSMKDLEAAGNWSSGYGINSDGSVVGTAEIAPGRFETFLWTPGSGLRFLGTLGGLSSYGMAINDAGLIVGNSLTRSGYTHAYLNDGNAMTDLGTLGGGNSYSYGVNGSGDIVGYSDTADGGSAGFLWSNGVMYDLNALVSPQPGWVLREAYGINDSGQIVGTGTYNGVSRAFRLDPAMIAPANFQLTAATLDAVGEVPEPGTFWMLAAGCLAAGLATRRRAR